MSQCVSLDGNRKWIDVPGSPGHTDLTVENVQQRRERCRIATFSEDAERIETGGGKAKFEKAPTTPAIDERVVIASAERHVFPQSKARHNLAVGRYGADHVEALRCGTVTSEIDPPSFV